jgi:hypothetical protein
VLLQPGDRPRPPKTIPMIAPTPPGPSSAPVIIMALILAAVLVAVFSVWFNAPVPSA